MSYQELLNDEVYWGSPESESFHVIKKIDEKENHVNIILESIKRNSNTLIKINKNDIQRFLENDSVEYVDDSGVKKSLVNCWEFYKRFNY